MYTLMYLVIALTFIFYTMYIAMNHIQKKIRRNFKYSKEEFDGIQRQIIREENSIILKKGRNYAYDPRTRLIWFVEKEVYGTYDVFALLHEVGHYNDDLKGRKLLIHMIIANVNRLLVIPGYLVSSIYISFGGGKSEIFNDVLILLSVLLTIHRLVFLVKYETSASKDAIKRITQYIENVDMKNVKKAAFMATSIQIVLALGVLFCLLYIKAILIYA